MTEPSSAISPSPSTPSSTKRPRTEKQKANDLRLKALWAGNKSHGDSEAKGAAPAVGTPKPQGEPTKVVSAPGTPASSRRPRVRPATSAKPDSQAGNPAAAGAGPKTEPSAPATPPKPKPKAGGPAVTPSATKKKSGGLFGFFE